MSSAFPGSETASVKATQRQPLSSPQTPAFALAVLGLLHPGLFRDTTGS